MNITKLNALPQGQWQKTAAFPDWKGYTDNTLAMNSMLSFHFWHGQGEIFLSVDEEIERFRLYVNENPVDTARISAGIWKVDIASVARNGANTLQLSNIFPRGLKEAVKVYIPYPVVLDGRPEEEGVQPLALQSISEIIQSDIAHGFTSVQMAVVRNGRLIYENAWGRTNSYAPDGAPLTASPAVTPQTLYDLASVTKMLAANYAIQKLVDDGKLDVHASVAGILGDGFFLDTVSIPYAGADLPPLEGQRAWKASLTVRDLLCHQGGFPADPQYHNLRFDAARRCYDPAAVNPLYAGSDGSLATRENTLKAIFKTPLMYEPGTQTIYSDVDYMLLGFIVEKITGQRLDDYLKKTFWEPMGLKRVAFRPLDNGFSPDDCAATELNGNTRDHAIDYPGVRTHTVQGQVQDEKSWYTMHGISGHAGLFGCARDLAKLASVMLTGGYGMNRFFSRNVMDSFTSPKSIEFSQWGLGWWREGDDQRPWYFGTQSSSGAIGHQGWTGTLVTIDPRYELVIVYLTNKINSPVTSPENTNRFDGNWFTASSLGFAAQLLSIGMDAPTDISGQLGDLMEDMAAESLKLIPEGASPTHPAVRNARSKIALLPQGEGRDRLEEELKQFK